MIIYGELYNTVININLTVREKEIIYLLSQGLDIKQIAEVLFISAFTVKTHINHIYIKTGFNSYHRLVVYFYKHQEVFYAQITGYCSESKCFTPR